MVLGVMLILRRGVYCELNNMYSWLYKFKGTEC